MLNIYKFRLAFISIVFLLCFLTNLKSAVVKIDNNLPSGNVYKSSWSFFEESVVLTPGGPCDILSIQVYYSGDLPAKDTLWVVGFPTSGNLWPTQYIWHFNSLIDPIIVEYDGIPGWKTFDISQEGLRSEGLDRIVIQHRLKPEGPWFTYDNNSRNFATDSWITDPYTPNSNFYNIVGTIYYYPTGDFMIRLNVKYDFTVGEGSDKPPAPQFIDVSTEAGLSGKGMSSVVDWNNDGWDDIVNAGNFFENSGKSKFTLINSVLNINRGNTTWGDFNNDGLIDIFVSLSWGNDKLYLNQGNNQYLDITSKTTIINNHPTMTPIWLDYNNDGLLDLFIANNRSSDAQGNETYYPDQLWKNKGDSTFTNVRNESGINNGEPNPYFDCYGASANDYNNDNFTDIFVANYRLARDNQYKNNGNNTFTDVGQTTGLRGVPTPGPDYFGHGMGCDWGDFNNDGFIDLCVGNLAHTDSRGQVSNPSLIFKNNGPPDYNFEEVHKEMGLKFYEGNAGALWLDFDNDGFLDLWHGLYSGGVNHFYHNQGPPDFKLKEITWVSGTVVADPWTASSIDYDNDGDLDILIYGILYRNDYQGQGNRIQIKLEGSPAVKVNMNCYGSRINIYAEGKIFHRQLSGSAGGSRCIQNSNFLHFGLGKVNIIDSLIIYYSNGVIHKITNIKPNAKYKIPYLGIPEILGVYTPSLLEPKNFSNNNIQNLELKWLESFGASSYLVEVFQDKDMNKLLISKKIENSNFFEYNFNNSTTYFWRVKAFYDNDSTNFSALWQFTVGNEKPSKISITFPISNQIDLPIKPTLKWTKPNYICDYCAKTKYDFEISNDTSFASLNVKRTELNDTLYSLDTILKSNSTYYLRARAVNNNELGEWSESIIFSTIKEPETPQLTIPVKDAINVEEKPRFEWEKIENTKYYELLVSHLQDFTDNIIEVNNIIVNKYRNLGKKLLTGTKYYWKTRAINDGGPSNWSDIWTFTTIGEKPSVEDIIFNLEIAFNPNPVSDNLNVNISSAIKTEILLQVIDIHGNSMINEFFEIGQGNQNNFVLNMSSLSSGIYFLRIINGKYTKTFKISVIE